MSSIIIKKDNFPDIVIQFILDCMMSTDINIDNDDWDIILEKINKSGLKAPLLKYYLNTDAVDKSKYKDIKKIFHKNENSKKETINIVNNITKTKKEKPKNITKIIKKVLKLIKSHKEHHYGMPLHEDTINKIIEKVLDESNDLLIKGD